MLDYFGHEDFYPQAGELHVAHDLKEMLKQEPAETRQTMCFEALQENDVINSYGLNFMMGKREDVYLSDEIIKHVLSVFVKSLLTEPLEVQEMDEQKED